MEFPKELKYTKEHEWIKEEDGHYVVGITDFAQDSLGDVVFVELPQEGSAVTKDEPFGVVESVKAVSDLYSPFTGTVVEVNDAVIDSPEAINDDPYGDAWMVKIKVGEPMEATPMLTDEEYLAFTEEEK